MFFFRSFWTWARLPELSCHFLLYSFSITSSATSLSVPFWPPTSCKVSPFSPSASLSYSVTPDPPVSAPVICFNSSNNCAMSSCIIVTMRCKDSRVMFREMLAPSPVSTSLIDIFPCRSAQSVSFPQSLLSALSLLCRTHFRHCSAVWGPRQVLLLKHSVVSPCYRRCRNMISRKPGQKMQMQADR